MLLTNLAVLLAATALNQLTCIIAKNSIEVCLIWPYSSKGITTKGIATKVIATKCIGYKRYLLQKVLETKGTDFNFSPFFGPLVCLAAPLGPLAWLTLPNVTFYMKKLSIWFLRGTRGPKTVFFTEFSQIFTFLSRGGGRRDKSYSITAYIE